MEMIKRLNSPTPDFFKKIQKWCVFLGLATGSISAYILKLDFDSQVGIFLGTTAGFLTVVAPLLAQLPIVDDKPEDEKVGDAPEKYNTDSPETPIIK